MPRPRTFDDDVILSAVARCVRTHGVANLTLAAVAAEAGLSPATLVQRFGSKRGLLLAFVGRNGQGPRRLVEKTRKRVGADASPLTVLRQALAAFSGDVRTQQEMANDLSFLQLDLADPEFGAHAATHARALLDEIATLLREAVAAGELAASTDVAALVNLVYATYNGTQISWAIVGSGSLGDAVGANVDNLLAAYR